MTVAAEHFCTLFDGGFLPQGMVLHASLKQHCPQAVLWVLCMDDLAERALRKLDLPDLRILGLAELETPELLEARADRSWGEYCWTMTPHLLSWMLETRGVPRVTYLDADLLFEGSPMELIGEMLSEAGRVLITPHDFGFGYGRPDLFGVFCVQFLTAVNDSDVRELLAGWGSQCRRWCYARKDGFGFGDQKYLDEWPDRKGLVHVLRATHLAHGPWRHSMLPWSRRGLERHVFHHFHQLRIFQERHVRLFRGYRIPSSRRGPAYRSVVEALGEALDRLESKGFAPRFPARPGGWMASLRRGLLRLLDLEGWARV